MLSKTIIDKMLNNLSIGSININYWDTETKKYGKGKAYTTIKIKNPSVIKDIIRRRDLGFAEAYINGLIEVPDGELIDFIKLIDQNSQIINQAYTKRPKYKYNRNVKSHQQQQIQSHYDLGNDFYKLWLDANLTYSCGYFKTPKDSIDKAQQQKVDYILRKLQLSPGHELLDIGCGWGHLIIRAAKLYKVKGLGITLSAEQYKYARALAKKQGVDDLAKFKVINYQDLAQLHKKFDRVVSVGMFEHVGIGNHRQYFETVNRLLKPQGVSVLHSITQQTEVNTALFIDKYIFPGGYIPSLRETISLMPEFGLRIVDVENLRMHYALTLRHWLTRFDKHIPEITKMYNHKFIRMWRLYLAGSISSFENSTNDLSQIIFTKGINNNLPLTRDYLYKKS